MTRHQPGRRWLRFSLWVIALYLLADLAYVVKSAAGFDMLPPSYGHHGAMFVGSDWLIGKLRPLLRGR